MEGSDAAAADCRPRGTVHRSITTRGTERGSYTALRHPATAAVAAVVEL